MAKLVQSFLWAEAGRAGLARSLEIGRCTEVGSDHMKAYSM